MVRNNCSFWGWKKSHRQGILRKGKFARLIYFVAFDVCWWIRESHWRECVSPSIEIVKKEKVFEDEVFIKNTCLGIGSENAGQHSNEDVVLSSYPVVLLANGFPRLNIYLRPPSFVVGTSGIPPNLNYKSVSPIMCLHFKVNLNLLRVIFFSPYVLGSIFFPPDTISGYHYV